jgi:hypothetical protein
MDPRIGVELGLWKYFYLRGGVNNFQKMYNSKGKKSFTVQPNIGAGFKYKDYVSVDYAYTDVGKASENQYSHVVSLVLGINKRKKKETSELINTIAPAPAVSPESTPENKIVEPSQNQPEQ